MARMRNDSISLKRFKGQLPGLGIGLGEVEPFRIGVTGLRLIFLCLCTRTYVLVG
jgi:hypothetical protein